MSTKRACCQQAISEASLRLHAILRTATIASVSERFTGIGQFLDRHENRDWIHHSKTKGIFAMRTGASCRKSRAIWRKRFYRYLGAGMLSLLLSGALQAEAPEHFTQFHFGDHETQAQLLNDYLWRFFSGRAINPLASFEQEYLTVSDMWLAEASDPHSSRKIHPVSPITGTNSVVPTKRHAPPEIPSRTRGMDAKNGRHGHEKGAIPACAPDVCMSRSTLRGRPRTDGSVSGPDSQRSIIRKPGGFPPSSNHDPVGSEKAIPRAHVGELLALPCPRGRGEFSFAFRPPFDMGVYPPGPSGWTRHTQTTR